MFVCIAEAGQVTTGWGDLGTRKSLLLGVGTMETTRTSERSHREILVSEESRKYKGPEASKNLLGIEHKF